MSTKKNIDKIIFLYLSGGANLEEIQELRRWLNDSPQNKKTFESITKYWNSSKIKIEAKDKDQAYSLLLQNIKHNQRKNRKYINPHNSSEFKNGWKYIGKIAAAVTLLLVFIASIKFVDNITEKQTPEKPIVFKQNPLGQKSTIKLPDGSTVWLNAQSSISYPEYFENKERRITLQGEAFFNIVKNKNRPFVVETQNMNISVLGTKFNVKAFPKECETNVSLVEGKVKVDKFKSSIDEESIILTPGEELEYNVKSGKIKKQRFDIEYVTAWKDGTLILKNDSFSSFVQKIQRWYGVEVKVVGEPSDNFIVTGKFQNENMENVLRALQFSRDFNFTIEDKLLTIKFK